MKRRAPRPPQGFYSSEPPVALGKMADRPIVPGVSAGARPPKGVPKHPARMPGVAGFGGKPAKLKVAKAKAPPSKAPFGARPPKAPSMGKPKVPKPPGVKFPKPPKIQRGL